MLGGKNFCDWVRQEFLGEKKNREIPQLNRVKRSKSAEEIQTMVKKITGEGKFQKKLWIYGMRRYSMMSLREIAEKVGEMSYYGVSKVVRRLEQETTRNRTVRHWRYQLHREMSRVQT